MSYIAEQELERMQHLIDFGASDNVSVVATKPVLEYHMKGADGNLYGIIKECNKYYVKVAPPKDTEVLAEDYNYIGGINNKKDYEYPSYALAYKQFELKMMSLNETYSNNKQAISESISKEEPADWQTQETKEMRAEIERFYQINENVSKILNEKTEDFTEKHTLPEAPAKNPSDKQVNSPYTDTAVAKGDKDFKKELTDHEKAGKPYDKDGKVSDAEMSSDKKKSGEKGEVYKEKAKYVPDNSVADKKPGGGKAIRVTEGKGKPVFVLTEAQVLAWQKELDYMDKSKGTKIGSTAPYEEKPSCNANETKQECLESEETCDCGKADCSICGKKESKKVNEGYYDEPQSPEEVLDKVHSLRSNIITLEDGNYVYFDYNPENNQLIAGGATNSGIIPDYTQEYDFDYSFDQNLQAFIETIESQAGSDSEMGESCGKKGKKVNEGDVMHNSDNQNVPTPGNGEIGDGQPYDKNVNEENIDVNDVAGMPDEEDDEGMPFPGVGSYYDDERLDPESTAYDPSDAEFDNIPDGEEWGFEDDDDIYGESKQNKGKNVNENITLTDFGKHPAYQKVVMTTPPNKEVSKVGKEWDDVSAQGDKPFGLQIGSNAPYTEDALDYLADAIIKEFFKGKKKS